MKSWLAARVRLDGAKAAIPYEKPRVASVEGTGRFSLATIIEEAEARRQERLKRGEPLLIEGEVVGY